MLKSHSRITRFATATFQLKKSQQTHVHFFLKYSKYMLYSPKFPSFYFQTELSLSYMHPCLHGLISGINRKVLDCLLNFRCNEAFQLSKVHFTWQFFGAPYFSHMFAVHLLTIQKTCVCRCL